MQAGHAFGGRGNAILFEERLVRPQCFFVIAAKAALLTSIISGLWKSTAKTGITSCYA